MILLSRTVSAAGTGDWFLPRSPQQEPVLQQSRGPLLSGLVQLLRNKTIIIRFLIKHVFIGP